MSKSVGIQYKPRENLLCKGRMPSWDFGVGLCVMTFHAPQIAAKTKTSLWGHRTELNHELGTRWFRCDGCNYRRCNYYTETILWLHPSCLVHIFHKISSISSQNSKLSFTKSFAWLKYCMVLNNPLPTPTPHPPLIYSLKWLVLLKIFPGSFWLLKKTLKNEKTA